VAVVFNQKLTRPEIDKQSVGALPAKVRCATLRCLSEDGAFPVLHYDGLASHGFLMQICGRKKFILYAPEHERTPDQLNVSRIGDIEHPDLNQFPLFAKAEPTTFTLEPGESLFIPGKWWHTIKMLTPSISISMNIVNGQTGRN
jgi:hypothetical protein